MFWSKSSSQKSKARPAYIPEGTPLRELHSHLYGALGVEDLVWLAGRREPRWRIFLDSYSACHGRTPDIDRLFTEDDPEHQLLKSYFHFKAPAPFSYFQACFDLVIALAHTDAEELAGAVVRAAQREEADSAEYRMLLAPHESAESFQEKTLALAAGAEQAEARTGKTIRIAMSLHRAGRAAEERYYLLKDAMARFPGARRFITGIDFCQAEEGHPPRLKADFLKRVHADNVRDPRTALAILYHVGESYEDRSIESAVRWVVEVCELGAHRLGHAVALGVAPELYANSVRQEVVSERYDHIQFLLQRADELREAGLTLDLDALDREGRELARRSPRETVPIVYDAARLEELRRFQDWAMERVRASGAIIESCPTSNLRIARLGGPERHPLARFYAADLPVVIGADDPGILDTGLRQELELVRAWPGVDDEKLRRSVELAARSESEALVRGETAAAQRPTD